MVQMQDQFPNILLKLAIVFQIFDMIIQFFAILS